MSIKVGDKDLFPYLGDYRPVNIYKGEHKVAGWKRTEQSGKELLFENTYNDFVEVEVDGKSYQDGAPTPDYPIEIHSLNDFDVVSSVGRENLLSNSKFGRYFGGSLLGYDESNYKLIDDVYYIYENPDSSLVGFKVNNPKDIVTFSGLTSYSSRVWVYYRGYNKNGNTTVPQNFFYISTHNGEFRSTERLISTHDTEYYHIGIGIAGPRGNNGWIKPKIETGNLGTPYSPAPEDTTEDSNHQLIDKINLLLSEPLRSVGDVKDRLFRDNSDGLWKVERNVGKMTFDGTENWGIWHPRDTSAMFGLSSRNLEESMLKTNGLAVSNMFPSQSVNTSDEEGMRLGTEPRVRIRVFYERIGTTPDSTNDDKIDSFKQWLSSIYAEGVPLTIVYEVETPAIETLDQELQDKLNNLRSFQGSNYIYTMVENLKPTLHARLKVKDI